MELLETAREHRAPVYHQKLYRWGCVPEARVLYPEVSNVIEHSLGHIYPMHKGVVLQEAKKGRGEEEEYTPDHNIGSLRFLSRF